MQYYVSFLAHRPLVGEWRGTRLAFTGRTSGGWQLFVIGRDGSDLRQVTAFTKVSRPSWGVSSTWVPGENAIIFDSDSSGTWSLYRVELGGDEGEVKYEEVFSSPGYDAFQCWVLSEKH